LAIGSWLGLDGIEVVRNGNLAVAIKARLAA